jgi:hypothetical protein
VLKRYINKDITLTLPEGKTLKDIKWFSVWCDEFAVDFGNVMIAKSLEFPRPQKIGSLHGIHAVNSDNIVIVDAQTLLIPNFSYDGTAPGRQRSTLFLVTITRVFPTPCQWTAAMLLFIAFLLLLLHLHRLDAKFWVGTGQRPTPNGLKIPDENGKELPLRRYDRKTIVLTLPNHLTVFDIGHFGVWCEGKGRLSLIMSMLMPPFAH